MVRIIIGIILYNKSFDKLTNCYDVTHTTKKKKELLHTHGASQRADIFERVEGTGMIGSVRCAYLGLRNR